ncbi:aspartate kinase [Lacticaseibacillus chiayiensis]|uniref:Aspartokinase n=1 Tax=Lacticaseibacillus chiayiensis TaxID=2100821 RepID=A0A4Q1U6E6_9LACO|nr:aspartate kinase [Lacticaseibacillus chiayiensis]QVI34856.1 aspartate kinase [Lacticaseibacillus chiayiensis]RXT27216.1 aspartate kinase [Lacticaseibacillus chiayiensis]UYN56612.1 aspartate kinase [Lacticaseibacillus chiayiensis]
MQVVKFGGSSLANGSQFAKVVAIMKANPARQVMVTSAPGKRHPGDVKVTDLLIQYAQAVLRQESAAEVVAKIVARYQAIADDFGLDPQIMQQISNELYQLPKMTFANHDYLMAGFKARGEKLNAFLMTAVLNHEELEATYGEPKDLGIVVTDHPNDAEVSRETYTHLEAFGRPLGVLVVPGFYGYTSHGAIATFSRGGSDITGAILANGFHADLYENFTDVDGVAAADPRVVANPQMIREMTYREMRELSYGGFGVFHDEAILPAIAGQIPINLKNTNHPDLPGTMIVPEQHFIPKHAITGIVSSQHFGAIYLHRYLLNKEVGFTLKLLQVLERHGISYEHMPSGIDDLTIILDDRQLNEAKRKAVCDEIQAAVHPDVLKWIDDYAIIMIVGEGMAQRTGLIQTILQPLASAGVHVSMINEGASQISLMLGTSRESANRAVKAIYNAFFIPINQRLEVH